MAKTEENNNRDLNQMSRRSFLKGALLTLGLGFIAPALILDSCSKPENTSSISPSPAVEPEKENAAEVTPAQPGAAEAPVSPVNSTQTADPSDADYSVTVDGLVNNCLTLNYASILQFPSVTSTVTLTCPGVFEETHTWTGVSIITILTAAGIKPEATQVMISGSGDYAAPFSVQQESITSGEIFLAFQVDGQGISADHGYPLRLVVPGVEGTSWVKSVTRIELV